MFFSFLDNHVQSVHPRAHSLPHCGLLSLSPAGHPTKTLASSSKLRALHWWRHLGPYLLVEAVLCLFFGLMCKTLESDLHFEDII